MIDLYVRGADAIADYLKCRRLDVFALAQQGRIRCARIGAVLVAHRPSLDAYLVEIRDAS